ncbi:hypothetical protein YYC_04758 [Plasmodium yoelii 17X]|uniref:Fam-b protein n=3 Tax=Plasmodium yoelii TaxID=5861 RepID=A0AAE9WPR9_PLAYO|nr:fam-b protein [Plasmodium yoelii]ETB57982.1 hypothetical protein YYC_04758 [Plasmodium yoelii 17X]WBY57626.1 fam-b protein [Plasmodium yoelii yoelii]CDU18229.1 fam-b protein [Plasmodium yoelii]VTZ78646.1 fam-b protein [Plasmodium yoelii]|eukprot:XP_022812298.1 fam-b protein [Plasmodium yoelii]
MQETNFSINDFYDSTLSILDKHDGGNCGEEEKIYTNKTIKLSPKDSKYIDILSELKDIENEVKECINEIASKLEISKKGNDDNGEYELSVESNVDKRIIKKDIHLLVSRIEDLKELKHSENILNVDNNYFGNKYNEVISGSSYAVVKCDSSFNETYKDFMKNHVLLFAVTLMCLFSGGLAIPLVILLLPKAKYTIKKLWKLRKLFKKKSRMIK